MLELLDENKFRFFRAKVVDNKDPKNMGRVKVWIPDLMHDIPDTDGLWARPANNPYGAGNTELTDGRRHAGSSHIPSVGHWVWVFLENDNPNLPYYVSALYIENQPILPENETGSEPWNKWVILRSPKGRTIMISDDPDDARVMITGKKNAYDVNDPVPTVYQIKNNQIVFIIDESGDQNSKPNQDKVILADYRGNYIRLHTYENKLLIYLSDEGGPPGEISLFTDKAMIRINNAGTSYIQMTNPGGTVNIDGSGVINIDAKKKVYINAGEEIVFSAPKVHVNCGNGEVKDSDEIPSLRITE